MSGISPISTNQLAKTCKLTGAGWAVWLKRKEKTWDLVLPGNLSKARQATIMSLIQESEAAAWLAGALSSGRTRSRQCGSYSARLNCQRIFAFPNPAERALLLVGAGDLDKTGLQIFQILALDAPVLKREFKPRDRMVNLGLIHQVVQQVVGLKDVQEIAQMTADLIAAYFKYEFSVVLVAEDDGQALVGAGVGGTSAHLRAPGFRYPSSLGLTGRAFRSGKSIYSNDLSQEPDYFSLSGWVGGSEICVPLREGNRVFGLINIEREKKHAFTDQDLQMLESLAGILSSVMMNAQRYQELACLNTELQESIQANQNAELQLIRTARMAAVGELAAGVAHELNNPLTTIAGFVELVLEEIPPGSQENEDLNLVLRETRRASGVVRQLLNFSRQTEKNQVLVDFNEISKDVLALVGLLIKTSGVQVKLEFSPSLPPVLADPNQMKQVLLNLIQNALQAMPFGGLLVIRTAEQKRQGLNGVAIAIQDSGEGISPENLGRFLSLFSPPGRLE
jgi:signal transduction histidine kinase